MAESGVFWRSHAATLTRTPGPAPRGPRRRSAHSATATSRPAPRHRCYGHIRESRVSTPVFAFVPVASARPHRTFWV
eukprot:7387043-Prymnesium_polylepis.2